MDVFIVSKGVHRAWWLWVKFWDWDCSISPLLLLDTQSRASHFNRWASVFLCKNGFNGSTYLTGLWQGCNEMCNVLGTESSMRQAPGTCQLSRLLCYPEYWGSFSHPPWQIPYAPACSRLYVNPYSVNPQTHCFGWPWLCIPSRHLPLPQYLPVRTLQIISLAQQKWLLERLCLIPLLNIHELPDLAISSHLYLPGLPYTPGHVPPERQDRSR